MQQKKKSYLYIHVSFLSTSSCMFPERAKFKRAKVNYSLPPNLHKYVLFPASLISVYAIYTKPMPTEKASLVTLFLSGNIQPLLTLPFELLCISLLVIPTVSRDIWTFITCLF